jgi:hypothetical protein
VNTYTTGAEGASGIAADGDLSFVVLFNSEGDGDS